MFCSSDHLVFFLLSLSLTRLTQNLVEEKLFAFLLLLKTPADSVAERALYLWNNDHIENLIRENCKVILPIIFPALEKNGRNHWNQVARSLTLNIRKIYSDVDPELFEECLLKFQEEEAKEEEIQAKHEATWKRLEEVAASNAVSSEAVGRRLGPIQTSSS